MHQQKDTFSMFTLNISSEFKEKCPLFVGTALYASVVNDNYSETLWTKINRAIEDYKKYNILDNIKQQKAIAATRKAYKVLGKDPNRYRPSAEALCRRILRGLPLYQINTLVDIINLVSIETGYSIGGFDAKKIAGDSIILGVGKVDEPYESIGRGMLNIEGLPVYRDNKGGIGTPTSDNERTKLEINTQDVLIIFNGYHGDDGSKEAVDLMIDLLKEFAHSKDEKIIYF